MIKIVKKHYCDICGKEVLNGDRLNYMKLYSTFYHKPICNISSDRKLLIDEYGLLHIFGDICDNCNIKLSTEIKELVKRVKGEQSNEQ